MHVYQPYLLPLLPESAGCPDKRVQSPLEEESVIRNLSTGDWPGWPCLAEEIRSTYGLSFMTGYHPDLKCDKCGTGNDTGIRGNLGRHSLRYLVLRDAGICHFMIEHPQGLPLYDQLGEPGQILTLGKPSLFTQLWLQGKSIAGGDRPPETFHEITEWQALNSLLKEYARSYRPSDWHLERREDHFNSQLRIDGRLCHDQAFTLQKGQWLINSIARSCHLEEGTVSTEREGSTEVDSSSDGPITLRISIIPTLHGESLVVRFLYPRDCSTNGLPGLGFNPDQVLLLEKQYKLREGLWIVGGPTGSGKSTTLHALLQWSVGGNEKILTVEDPVERLMDGVQQVSIGNPPGMTYAVAIRAFLRQSPDSILIGEIRDEETAALSIQAARTGHRVLSSLHARNPTGILQRFEDLGHPSTELDAVLRILILQRLVPLLCPVCRKLILFDNRLQEALPARLSPFPEQMAIPSGCGSCREGFKGQTVVAWCSTWPCTPSCTELFLPSAWALFCEGRIDLHTFLSFLPPEIQDRFPLCQPQGFC